jgi:hypothetical protein
MADLFPGFDLNEPVSEDDDGNVEFHLFDHEDDDGNDNTSLTTFLLHCCCFVHVW